MTFLATVVIFTVALSFVWLATHRNSRQHECSCSRSKRVLADYERIHNRAGRDQEGVFIPSKAIVPVSRESVS